MKIENKQYKLKRWYPSLDERLEVGDIGDRYLYEFGNGTKEDRFTVLKGGRLIYIPIEELHPDFWELIEEEKPKPLFTTEDGVEVFSNNVKLFAINELFAVNEIFRTASDNNFDFLFCKKEGWKLFFHKANADKYIEENKPKPLFITEDEVEVYEPFEKVIIVTHDFEKIYAIANQCFAEASSNKDKLFKHESNADEYIWHNKRVFSYEDVVEWYGYGFKLGREGIYETLERLAIERSK